MLPVRLRRWLDSRKRLSPDKCVPREKERQMLSKSLSLIAAGIALTLGIALKGQGNDQMNLATTLPPTPNHQGSISAPVDPGDTIAWRNYLTCITRNNSQGMVASRFYLYFIPGGSNDQAGSERVRQIENVKDVLVRGVQPGNLLAFGGPDADITAKVVTKLFSETTSRASIKNVIVVVIGHKSDETRLVNLIESRNAIARFIDVTTATCSAAEASAITPWGMALLPPPVPPHAPALRPNVH